MCNKYRKFCIERPKRVTDVVTMDEYYKRMMKIPIQF